MIPSTYFLGMPPRMHRTFGFARPVPLPCSWSVDQDVSLDPFKCSFQVFVTFAAPFDEVDFEVGPSNEQAF